MTGRSFRVTRIGILGAVAAVLAAGSVVPRTNEGSRDPAYRLAAAVTKTVTMADDYFSPKKVSITRGSKVKWVNQGDNSHTTTGAGWDKTLSPGASFAKKFKSKGTFKYRCLFHQGMTGKVVVV